MKATEEDALRFSTGGRNYTLLVWVHNRNRVGERISAGIAWKAENLPVMQLLMIQEPHSLVSLQPPYPWPRSPLLPEVTSVVLVATAQPYVTNIP